MHACMDMACTEVYACSGSPLCIKYAGWHRLLICDMGIARVKQPTEATVTCDRRGAGTYPYMAPEMFTKSHQDQQQIFIH